MKEDKVTTIRLDKSPWTILPRWGLLQIPSNVAVEEGGLEVS